MKKSYQANAPQQPDTADKTTTERTAAGNKGLAKCGVQWLIER